MSLAKPTKKTLIISLIVGMVILGVLLIFLEVNHRTDIVKKPSTIQRVKEEASTSEEKKQTYLDKSPPTTTDNSGTVTSQTGYTPPQSDESITLEAKRDQSNIVIVTQLKGYSDGRCRLSISGAGTYTQDVDVIYQPSYATCAGFSVPVSSVGAGTWQIKLVITSGGVENEKTLTYEVK